MKSSMPVLSVIAGLLLFPAIALSQTITEDAAAYQAVQSMLADGSSPSAVVDSMVARGMTLSEATVFAMVSGGEQHRVAIASAGVAAADTLAEARTVANAVVATSGESGPVAVAVREALNRYADSMPAPSVYEDDYTPTGAGVSPAA